MFGTAGDLRCPRCADQRRQRYGAPRVRWADGHAYVTDAVMVLAIVASVMARFPWVGGMLIDVPAAVWDGEIWRLWTTVLPHGDFLHAAFNLYWLWRFGSRMEPAIGRGGYLGFLLLGAGGSSAASFLFEGPAIGLSGVIYAMAGFLFALRKDRGYAAEAMPPWTAQLFVLWFFFCIATTRTGVLMTANVAHAAGAVLGYAMGAAVRDRRRRVWVALVAAACLTLPFATLYMPWSADYAVHAGDRRLAAGDQQGAEVWYGRALAAKPGFAPALVRLHSLRQPGAEP